MPHENHKKLDICIKRAYENAIPEDGYRVLVDRIWPRGRSKAILKLDQWARDLAPSADLRKWFGHDPKRWEAFQQRYRSELDTEEKREQIQRLLAEADDQSHSYMGRRTKSTIRQSCCGTYCRIYIKDDFNDLCR